VELRLERPDGASSRARKSHPIVQWSETLASQLSFVQSPSSALGQFNLGWSIVAQNRDNIKCGQHTLVRREHVCGLSLFVRGLFSAVQGPYSPLAAGEVVEILVPCGASPLSSDIRILVCLFSLGEHRHPLLKFPTLHRTSEHVFLTPEVSVSAPN
jgi:hypothetical protein